MKLVITQFDGDTEKVVSVLDTNLTDEKDLSVVSVGEHGKHLVPDNTAYVEGDVFYSEDSQSCNWTAHSTI